MKSFLHKYWLPALLVFLLVAGASVGVLALVLHHGSGSDVVSENPPSSSPTEPETPPAPALPDFINLQPTVDQWLSSLPQNAEVGLMIYDLDHNQTAAAYHPDEVFNAASIYKLFFVYDGYRQIENGLEDPDTYFVTANDEFHSGSLTFDDCLDLMIRESYNTCADPMRSDSSRYARAEALAAELGLKNTSSAGLYSSAADLTEILKLYYQHPDLSAASWAKIQDSMLNQPPTTYNWRQGLPSGFSERALVYDKVGWNWTGSYWDPYNDAAILEIPELNRHYIVVVMTRFLPNTTPLINLGTSLEQAIFGNSLAKNSLSADESSASSN